MKRLRAWVRRFQWDAADRAAGVNRLYAPGVRWQRWLLQRSFNRQQAKNRGKGIRDPDT